MYQAGFISQPLTSPEPMPICIPERKSPYIDWVANDEKQNDDSVASVLLFAYTPKGPDGNGDRNVYCILYSLLPERVPNLWTVTMLPFTAFLPKYPTLTLCIRIKEISKNSVLPRSGNADRIARFKGIVV